MRPIEPGCLCIVVGATKPQYYHYIGKQVVAVRAISEGEIGPTGLTSRLNGIKTWLIKGEGFVATTRLGKEFDCGGLTLCAEHNLMRIDGHKELTNILEAEHG